MPGSSHLYCQLAEEGSVSKRALAENLEEGLKREPNDLRLLAAAYDLAREQDDWARRLSCALQLSKHGKTAADHVIYGIECGRNAMPERAEGAFKKALELDQKSVAALNGLAMCSFERMELGRAEELFRKSQKAEPNDGAVRMLKKIELLRKGEAGGIPQEVLEALAGYRVNETIRRTAAEADGGGRG